MCHQIKSRPKEITFFVDYCAIKCITTLNLHLPVTMGPEQFLIDKIPNQPNYTSFLRTFEKETHLRNTRIKLLLGCCGSVLEGIFKYDYCTLRNLLCTVEINLLLLWTNRSFWSTSTKKKKNSFVYFINKFQFELFIFSKY